MPFEASVPAQTFICIREIHNLDPQPHRHCMLAPRAFAPRVTRCSLGKYWSRDSFQKEGSQMLPGIQACATGFAAMICAVSMQQRDWLTQAGWLGIQDVILSRSDRLPKRWGQQAASLGYTGYL